MARPLPAVSGVCYFISFCLSSATGAGTGCCGGRGTEQVRKCIHSITVVAPLRLSSSRFAQRLRGTCGGRKVCFISPYKVSSKGVFTAIHVERVTLEMPAEMLVGLHVKCPFLMSDFNQNSSAPTNCSRTLPVSAFMNIL